MTINRPKFYNLQSHLLPRKTYCATIFGNCFPSVNGPPQYTLEYNIELVRFFYTCIENIAALLNDNELAYKYINFSQNNKLLEEYELEKETITTKKAQFKYDAHFCSRFGRLRRCHSDGGTSAPPHPGRGRPRQCRSSAQ